MADMVISNITGLLDVEALVKNLTASKQRQIQKLNQNKALLQAKVSSLNNFLSGIRDLQSFLGDLRVEDLFRAKRATVSDPSILSAKVTQETLNVTLKVKVLGLSQGEIRASSEGVVSATANLPASTFTLRYWTSPNSYQDTTINFTGGTLQDLVNTINQSQNYVEASIYFDGNTYRLLLAEKNVGASTKETDPNINSFTIELSAGTLPTPLGNLSIILQEAKNSRIKIGSDSGAEITSATNTFKDVIRGLEITAQKPSQDFVQITINDSFERVTTSLNELLKKINSALNLSQELTGKGALFQGNSTLNQVKIQVFNLTNPLQKLGLLDINESGQYSLNVNNLNELISSGRIEDLKRAIRNTQEGLTKYLEDLSKTLQLYVNTQDRQINTLNQRVETLAKSIAREEEKLRVTFTKIEALMYENSQLRSRLENFMVSLNENKK
ncbi:MAG: hypothetical protein N2327_02815 [Caldimicrobium sp.]|nr:hypothetical protein [Caldimicrobium sp.]MCX7873353.1 hypothetical protein [Caldimicrobium sp.]MDW8093409.1 flagellar cap protein FliD N-terminal domain-containing protein [Caldimicrobium sp.]